jgi:hypothetical protein
MVLLLEPEGHVWGTTLVWSTYVLHNFMTQYVLQYGRQGGCTFCNAFETSVIDLEYVCVN